MLCFVVVRRFNSLLPHISSSLVGATLRCFFSHPHLAPAHQRAPDDLRVSCMSTSTGQGMRFINVPGEGVRVVRPFSEPSLVVPGLQAPVAPPPSIARQTGTTGAKRKRNNGPRPSIDPQILQQSYQQSQQSSSSQARQSLLERESDDENEEERSQTSSAPSARNSQAPSSDAGDFDEQLQYAESNKRQKRVK